MIPDDDSTTRRLKKRKSGLSRLFRRRRKNKDGKSIASQSQAEDAALSVAEKWASQEQAPSTPPPKSPPSTLKSSTDRRYTKSPDRGQELKTPRGPTSWLARSKFFRGIIDSAFDSIDADGSGDLDEKELYSGLLLIHLKLGTYAGPAACKPITREKCHSVFMKMDADGSGHLDREEFAKVMMVLFGNVMMRVAFQYAATLMVVPLLAKTILDTVFYLYSWFPWVLAIMDPYTPVEEIMEGYWNTTQQYVLEKTPNVLVTMGEEIAKLLAMVPSSVWATIPLTLISTVLSMMIVPWLLMKVDEFFQNVAGKEGGRAPPDGKGVVIAGFRQADD